jgi:hypothetical protein
MQRGAVMAPSLRAVRWPAVPVRPMPDIIVDK